jgi:hypothetical protein
MDAMVKSRRMSEVFTSSYSPQLLNRQKNTASIKNMSTVEHIELEALKDGPAVDMHYRYEAKANMLDSFRESDDGLGKPLLKEPGMTAALLLLIGACFYQGKANRTAKSLSFQLDKAKPASKETASGSSIAKLTKSKSEIQSSSSLLNTVASGSLLTTKLPGKEPKKDKKDKKDKKKPKAKEKTAGGSVKSQVSSVTNMACDSDLCAASTRLKRADTFSKPIIKKGGSSAPKNATNPAGGNKPLTPEKENVETVRWRYEVADAEKEALRLQEYKRDRRRRYIDQRNKHLANASSSSFLPFLYYEEDAEGAAGNAVAAPDSAISSMSSATT